jgi:peptidoglycan/xylan/chitin deacetylase (PgdA/CDA1 family)
MNRKPVLCLTFDNLGEARNVFTGKSALPDPTADGVAIGYPNILNLLAKFDLRATFFVEGWSALHYGGVIDALLEGGHEIGMHGWIHEDFASLSCLTARQYVSDGLAVLKLRGVRPAGFRAPGGKIGAYGRDILAEAGFSYDSSVDTALSLEMPPDIDSYVGDGLRRLPNGLIQIPWQWFMIDAIQYLFSPDGFRDPADLVGYWGGVLHNVARANGFLTMIFHAHVTGVDPARLDAMEQILKLALQLEFDILSADRAINAAGHVP